MSGEALLVAETTVDWGLVDKVAAVAAMLVAIRPVISACKGSDGRLSWRRSLVLAAGGLFALAAVTGLLVVRLLVLDEPNLFLPTRLGGTLSFFGGMLGLATVLAGRPSAGGASIRLTEDSAIRHAVLAAAMSVYAAAPTLAAAAAGITWMGRALLPWTPSEPRWARIVEGGLMLLLCVVPRDGTVGGLRAVSGLLGLG